MDTRREFVKKAMLLSGGAGLSGILPASIQRALAIDPAQDSTYLDAEHIVILMQENRSFDHCFGSIQGARGFNDPRAIVLPDQNPVWLQSNEQGDTYAPFRLNLQDTKSTWMGWLPHLRSDQVDAHNHGKHDQWLVTKRSSNPKYADLPLTLGYYTREDLPFHYGLADAFTLCDQNFSSALTSTIPNRSFFMTGKITHPKNGHSRVHIRNEDYSYAQLPWTTFPELLEENQITWKVYQNEISCGGGFTGEARAWLSNFGCNLLEYFAAYNVKFAPRYIQGLQNRIAALPREIDQLRQSEPSNGLIAKKVQAEIANKQKALDEAKAELALWNKKNFDKLSEKEKSLFQKAFTNNSGDAYYRAVTKLNYYDGETRREVTVPEGDILHQFRKDVQKGKLPTVSWLVGTQNFSDHPSAPWYGAWYVSEVLDILARNPEVWKKTIFILTYDENDGFFDHVPPFSIPDAQKPGTGKCPDDMDTAEEHIRLEDELRQGVPQKEAREAPIGLGYRVPMIIASPWSRGGKICSQLFDHTSTLQFLETFLNKKFNKQISTQAISPWRRAICGDLTAAFSPFDGEKLQQVPFLKRDPFVQSIFNAKFKQEPSGYKKLSKEDIEQIRKDPLQSPMLPAQEQGVRPSCALPYELYADGKWNVSKQEVELQMEAGVGLFGSQAAGSPFSVYAPGSFSDDKGVSDTMRRWSFAVPAGKQLSYGWPLKAFADQTYHLRLHGPNGFYREFRGSQQDPLLDFSCAYERDPQTQQPTGNLVLKFRNLDLQRSLTLMVTDLAYQKNTQTLTLEKAGQQEVVLNLKESYGWYDFSLKAEGFGRFEKQYAGRVETGVESFSDPAMGQVPV